MEQNRASVRCDWNELIEILFKEYYVRDKSGANGGRFLTHLKETSAICFTS